MKANKPHVCPPFLARVLDNRLRRWFQNPQKILAPYISEGMTVADLGCGPGFFSVDMARMVGSTGRMIAVDLQEKMLEWVAKKVQHAELQSRCMFRQCEKNRIGLDEELDFALAFYVVHETPDQEAFLKEVASLMKPNGRFLLAEPVGHVSKSAFYKTVEKAQNAGMTILDKPKIILSRTVLLGKMQGSPVLA